MGKLFNRNEIVIVADYREKEAKNQQGGFQ